MGGRLDVEPELRGGQGLQAAAISRLYVLTEKQSGEAERRRSSQRGRGETMCPRGWGWGAAQCLCIL